MAELVVPDRAVLLHMYEVQFRIVQCDERFGSQPGRGEALPAPGSSRGRECVTAAYAEHLRADDVVVSAGAGLHDHIARGVPLGELWAECLGRADGAGKGKGGPAQITHTAAGVVATSGGAAIPVAGGMGIASQLDSADRVVVASIGGEAVPIGPVQEGLAMAVRWKLPVVVVCDADGTGRSRADAFGTAGATVDRSDPVALWNAAGEAVARARAGEGPSLLEVVGTAADAVPRYRAWLLAGEHTTEDELADLEARAVAEVDDAVRFAAASPAPALADLLTDVYAEVAP